MKDNKETFFQGDHYTKKMAEEKFTKEEGFTTEESRTAAIELYCTVSMLETNMLSKKKGKYYKNRIKTLTDKLEGWGYQVNLDNGCEISAKGKILRDVVDSVEYMQSTVGGLQESLLNIKYNYKNLEELQKDLIDKKSSEVCKVKEEEGKKSLDEIIQTLNSVKNITSQHLSLDMNNT